MTGRWRLFAGVALPALAGFWLANVAPAHSVACTTAADTANATTCTGGATNGELTYVSSNATYSEGDFTLRLDNHDVTAGGIGFSGTIADTAGALGEGDGVIILENGSDVTNEAGDGINAFNAGAGEDLTIDLRDTSTVSGSSNGIVAQVRAGNILLTTRANVTGGGGDGINATATDSIFIFANGNVTGGDFGIAALSTGDSVSQIGNLTIRTTANTSIIGRSRDGIQAIASDSLEVTTNGNVSGQESGIFARGGTVRITTGTGSQIGGTTRDGIDAKANFVEVTTGANSAIGGGKDGINAVSDAGNVTVITGENSSVTGTASNGIDAQSDSLGAFSTVTVTTGAESIVNGAVDGILARSVSAAITVTMEEFALVHGRDGGIAALSQDGNVLVRTGAGSEVTGDGGDGIIATSSGGGTVAVTMGDGSAVSGGNDGIFAESLGGGGAVSVAVGTGSDINGDIDGIDARSVSGALSLATGAESRVTGFASAIRATSASGVITITTGEDSKVEGGGEGISASTRGAGTITITTNGETVGSGAGIRAASETGAIRIINTGTITNLSRDVDDLAIETSGGVATIDNNGTILGRIETSGGSLVLNNAGIWTTRGASDFAGANDTVNNSSVIFVGADAGVAETMSFAGLETLNNAGRIDLMDRVSGDGNRLSDRLQTSGNYIGLNGAVLAVDASLGGAGSVSDVLAVGGNTSGVTRILVNNTSLEPGVLNTAGILVVDVAGTASASDFALADGPIDTGFFVYDLIFKDGQSGDQFLLVSAADGDVFETLATVAASQEIWRATASVWEGRQQTVRDRLGTGVAVTAVADPTLPGRAEPEHGLWFSGLGSWTARDAEIAGFDLDYDQSIYGFVAGADFGTDLGTGGSTLLFGLMAGYVDSSLNFDQSSTSIKTDGATFGIYASLIDGGFFASILVQADRLDLDYSAPSLPSDAHDDTDVSSIGGRADIGYRFGGGLFIEPMLSLDAIATRIDVFSVGGADIDPGTNDSIRGGVGLRAGFDGEIVRASITGRVWDVFSNENEVDFTPAGPVLAISDDTLEGTYGEVAGQVDLDLSSSTVLFARGSLLFSDDVTRPSVSGGLSLFW